MSLPLALAGAGGEPRLSPAPSRAELRRWIEALPAANPQEALTCCAERLEAMNRSRIGRRQKSELAELFGAHIETLLPAVERDLSEAILPLSPRRRGSARIAHEALAGLVCAHKSVLVSLTGRTLAFGLKQKLLAPLVQCLNALARRLALSHRVYAPHPRGVWHEMHLLFRLAVRYGVAECALPGTGQTPAGVYRDALLLAFAEPHQLMQGDVERVIAYLARFGERAELRRREEEPSGPGVFVVRPERDAPGWAIGKSRPETAAQNDLLLDCRRLVDAAREQMARLGRGAALNELELPVGAAGPVARDLLSRLVQQWGGARSRRFKRLYPQQRVDVALGLGAVWDCLVGGRRALVTPGERSGWIVANESPGGFALLHISGGLAPIRVGEAVGLRAEGACRICIVRWMRSENPDHLELGLQELAPAAVPVTVGEDHAPAGVPALLLPEMPALRKAATILAPLGRMNSDSDYRLLHRGLGWRVRTTLLVEQTPSVQLFRFNPSGGLKP